MNTRRQRSRPGGFTLIELLVVTSLIALLTAMVVQASSKHKAQAASCLSNLRQVNTALQLYFDDNNERLCGGRNWGLATGQSAAYTSGSYFSLSYHLARYLGAPAPDGQVRCLKVMVCPAVVAPDTSAPAELTNVLAYAVPAAGRNAVGQGRVPLPWAPFGAPPPDDSPGSIGLPPHTLAEIAALRPLGEIWALGDVDKKSFPDAGPSVLLPSRPVHGSGRNYLFFDGHTAARPVDNGGE